MLPRRPSADDVSSCSQLPSSRLGRLLLQPGCICRPSERSACDGPSGAAASQILTIIMVLTAKVSHEGKHLVNEANTKDECWYEPADVAPVPIIQVLFASQAILFYRPPVQEPVPMMFKLLPFTKNTKIQDEFQIHLENGPGRGARDARARCAPDSCAF